MPQTSPTSPTDAKGKFLGKIERFLKRSKLSATGLGREALGDTSFVHRLRVGREARTDTQKKVLGFIREYRRC